jgi:catechol 2,3-dioxygenase-like lactoylglutathione lyase family enzyme
VSGAGLRLDHVALAVRDAAALLPVLVGRWCGVVIGGGIPPEAGFRGVQVRLGRGEEGMTVELIEPWEPQHNDFLTRFLDAAGEGPHHLTFKVADVEAERDRLRGIGIEPVAMDFSDPSWREMFVHPRDAHGPLIQIAQPGWEAASMTEVLAAAAEGVYGWGSPWWPPEAVSSEAVALEARAAATVQRVVVVTPDPDRGRRFYRDVLGGDEHPAGPGRWDLVWPGGAIRLEAADVPRARIDRLELTGPPPGTVEVGGACFVAE